MANGNGNGNRADGRRGYGGGAARRARALRPLCFVGPAGQLRTPILDRSQ